MPGLLRRLPLAVRRLVNVCVGESMGGFLGVWVCLHAKGSAGPLTIARGPNLVLWQHAILTLKLGGGRDGHGQDDEELAEHGSCHPVCGVSVLGFDKTQRIEVCG